ncbi:nucleotidyltransferase domain-containing protein [Paenibacillus aurantius]|uniref:Nucleotidyltransferase domain-containing protein n=1 Tax=Paenibacillus aurantius TaxID=2918900 RepID=A0AA96LE17_9BACL|nr:nucleotidyltransferase domain-containing protein [Paenibacillus aurantius]WNQ12067.1 nucleotidyltransferase domain-containing protein [Paenibacillus aurantius]
MIEGKISLDEFIVLVGSVARSDFFKESDIDVCRINCYSEVDRRSEWPNGPISYIDYELDVFKHLFNAGSLFIYHLLFEGVLLEGDIKRWNYFKSQFVLKCDFSEEINKIKEIMCIFNKVDIFGNHYMSLFSNLFINIKNFSIFYLASNGRFVFNKKQAIKYVFGDYYLDLLFDSYNQFERGIISNHWNYDRRKKAEEIIEYYQSKMEELSNVTY